MCNLGAKSLHNIGGYPASVADATDSAARDSGGYLGLWRWPLQDRTGLANWRMLWLLYALGAAVIWGVNYAVSGRLLERGVSPQTLFLVDLFFGAVVMCGFLTLTGRWQSTLAELQAARSDWAWLVVAVVATTSAGMLIFLSIQAKNATLSSLIEISYPLFTAFFAWVLFRQTTMNLATVIGAVLIFIGVIVVARGNR